MLEADAARVVGAAGDSLAVGEGAAGKFPGHAPGGGQGAVDPDEPHGPGSADVEEAPAAAEVVEWRPWPWPPARARVDEPPLPAAHPAADVGLHGDDDQLVPPFNARRLVNMMQPAGR